MTSTRRLAIVSLLALATAIGACSEQNGPPPQPVPSPANDPKSVLAPATPTGDTQNMPHTSTGYRYRFRMVSPPNDNNAITEREVYLWFWPDTTRVWFRLENRIGTPIKIMWNDTRFITTDGRSFKTIHEGITYDRRYDPQDWTQVYGLQRYNGWIAPVDILEDPTAAQGVGMRKLFLTDNSALGNLNKTFQVDFYLEIDGTNRRYPLIFKIDSVVPPS